MKNLLILTLQAIILLLVTIGIFLVYSHYILAIDRFCIIKSVEATCFNFWEITYYEESKINQIIRQSK